MQSRRLLYRLGLVCLAITLGAALFTPVRAANNGKPQSAAAQYSDLTALWWEWAFGQPTMDIAGTNTNPVLDSTGAFADSGQESGIGPGNKYFFLAGTFGGDVTRNVTVPAGKTLFFPVYNFEVDNALDPPTNNTVPQLRALAKANIDSAPVANLYARLDGQPVTFFRTTSPTFEYTLPDENSLYDYFGLVGPQFEGTVRPVVSDGYWAVIPPLPPGQYTVEFGNTGLLNITYHLTVQ